VANAVAFVKVRLGEGVEAPTTDEALLPLLSWLGPASSLRNGNELRLRPVVIPALAIAGSTAAGFADKRIGLPLSWLGRLGGHRHQPPAQPPRTPIRH
jgi:hypothetical protein